VPFAYILLVVALPPWVEWREMAKLIGEEVAKAISVPSPEIQGTKYFFFLTSFVRASDAIQHNGATRVDLTFIR